MSTDRQKTNARGKGSSKLEDKVKGLAESIFQKYERLARLESASEVSKTFEEKLNALKENAEKITQAVADYGETYKTTKDKEKQLASYVRIKEQIVSTLKDQHHYEDLEDDILTEDELLDQLKSKRDEERAKLQAVKNALDKVTAEYEKNVKYFSALLEPQKMLEPFDKLKESIDKEEADENSNYLEVMFFQVNRWSELWNDADHRERVKPLAKDEFVPGLDSLEQSLSEVFQKVWHALEALRDKAMEKTVKEKLVERLETDITDREASKAEKTTQRIRHHNYDKGGKTSGARGHDRHRESRSEAMAKA